MSTTSGKQNEYNRSVTAGLDYTSVLSSSGFGTGETAFGFALGVRT
jgi:hypothetical protein